MNPTPATAVVPDPVNPRRVEDAGELARRLAHLLDELAAEVPQEHDELRLAAALAGSLSDELDSVAQRLGRKPLGTRGAS